MKKEEHNQRRKPNVQLTRTKWIWTQFLKDYFKETWKEQAINLDEIIKDEDFDQIWVNFESNMIPIERWIVDKKVSSLQVEIVWYKDISAKWNNLLNHIDATNS